MDETIRIRSIESRDWGKILQGFELEKIEQLLELFGADGCVVGTICETVDGKYYINSQAEVEYTSLQGAAAALLKTKQ